MAVKLDTEALRYIAALESTTGAEVKDCIVNKDTDTIIYVVKQGHIGIAIGKGGSNIKRLSTKLGKKMHIVELHSDPVKFAGKLLGTVTVKNITLKQEAGEKDGEMQKKIIILQSKKSQTIINSIIIEEHFIDIQRNTIKVNKIY